MIHNKTHGFTKMQNSPKSGSVSKTVCDGEYCVHMHRPRLLAYCSLRQEQAAVKQAHRELRSLRHFILNCVREHFERLELNWPDDEEGESNESQGRQRNR